MSVRNFASKRGRILRSGRPSRTIARALAHLADDFGATAFYSGRQLVAHRLPSGRIICELRRYSTERAAIEELANIQAFAHLHEGKRLPRRHFYCDDCKGFHVTSRA